MNLPAFLIGFTFATSGDETARHCLVMQIMREGFGELTY